MILTFAILLFLAVVLLAAGFFLERSGSGTQVVAERLRNLVGRDVQKDAGIDKDARYSSVRWLDATLRKLNVGEHLSARSGALRAHATQVDPNEPWWFGLTDDELAAVYPWEDWVLAASHVGFPAEGEIEDDLFAGVRTRAAR